MEIWQIKEVNINCEREKVANVMAATMTKRHKRYITAIKENGVWVVTNRFDPIIKELTKPLLGEIK